MTLTGGIKLDEAPRTVDLVSRTAWQEVARLKWSEFGGGGNTTYAFWITGKVGNFTRGPAVRDVIVELSLGKTGTGGVAAYMFRVDLLDARLRGPETGVPFQFLLVVSSEGGYTSDPTFGSSWTATEDLIVFARVRPITDPDNRVATFDVADLSLLWWDLTALGASAYHAENVIAAAGGELNNVGAEAWKNWITTSAPGALNENWLHFFQVWYAPRGVGLEAAGFRFGYVDSGSAFHALVGTDHWGLAARGRTDLARSSYHHGGFWPLGQPEAGTTFRLEGLDPHANTNARTRVQAVRYFGVRVEDQYGYDDATAAIAQNRVTGYGFTDPFWPFEPTQPAGLTTYVTLAQSIVKTRLNSGLTFLDHAIELEGADGGVDDRVVTRQTLRAMQAGFNEGAPLVSAVVEPVGPGTNYVRSNLLHWPRSFDRAPVATAILDVAAVGFSFENNPDNVALPQETPGADLVIVPGRESLDVGSLSILPLEPDSTYQELEDGLDEGQLLTDAAYLRTWPLFTGPRRVFSGIAFSGLTESEATTLMAFFVSDPTFAWTPPLEVAGAYALLGRPRATKQPGNLWTISTGFIELVHTGP